MVGFASHNGRPGWPPKPKRRHGRTPPTLAKWLRCAKIVKRCRWGECQCGLLSGHGYPDHVCPHGYVQKGRGERATIRPLAGVPLGLEVKHGA
jgi:hypothetical protein